MIHPDMEGSPMAPPNNAPEPTDSLAFTVLETCKTARVGKTFLYQEISAGRLRAKKAGRKTLILPSDLSAWLRSLPDK
jgi:excisionase family DNA binding protein